MEDLDKFSIGDFFIKMEKLDRKQRIGLKYVLNVEIMYFLKLK